MARLVHQPANAGRQTTDNKSQFTGSAALRRRLNSGCEKRQIHDRDRLVPSV